MSLSARRLQLEVLAFAANALLIPSAAIFGGLILMGVVLVMVGTGINWDEHPAIARVIRWFLPPEGSYTGEAAAGIFAQAFFKANFVLYLLTLPARLILQNRPGWGFRADALVLLGFTAVLAAGLAVIILSVKFTNGGNASMALGCAVLALVGYVFALPYVAAINRVNREIRELAEEHGEG